MRTIRRCGRWSQQPESPENRADVPYDDSLNLWSHLSSTCTCIHYSTINKSHFILFLKPLFGVPKVSNQKSHVYRYIAIFSVIRRIDDVRSKKCEWENRYQLRLYGALSHKVLIHFFRFIAKVKYTLQERIVLHCICRVKTYRWRR